MNTEQIIQKHNSKNKSHIHHPFIFYCISCNAEIHCFECKEYEHEFCYSCQKFLPEEFKSIIRSRLINGISKKGWINPPLSLSFYR